MKTANENHVDRIIHDIGALEPCEKLEILEKLVQLIKKSDFSQPRMEYSLLQLRGLGKEIFKKEERLLTNVHQKDTLVEFLRNSPLSDSGIELERDKDYGREVKL